MTAKRGSIWGWYCWQIKDHERAGGAFIKAIKNNSSGTADAHNNIGVLFAIKGDWEEAEKQFSAASKTSRGNSAEARLNLAICRDYRDGKYTELIARLRFSADKKISGE